MFVYVSLKVGKYVVFGLRILDKKYIILVKFGKVYICINRDKR